MPQSGARGALTRLRLPATRAAFGPCCRAARGGPRQPRPGVPRRSADGAGRRLGRVVGLQAPDLPASHEETHHAHKPCRAARPARARPSESRADRTHGHLGAAGSRRRDPDAFGRLVRPFRLVPRDRARGRCRGACLGNGEPLPPRGNQAQRADRSRDRRDSLPARLRRRLGDPHQRARKPDRPRPFRRGRDARLGGLPRDRRFALHERDRFLLAAGRRLPAQPFSRR